MISRLGFVFGLAALFFATAAAADPASPNSGPAAATSSKLGAPPSGKAQVVFFRPSSLMGAVYWAKVRENGTEVGKLSNGNYFVLVAAPGQHTYTASLEATDTIKLELDPDETYFVEARMTMGVAIYRVNLAPSDEARFEKTLHGMKQVPPATDAKPSPAGG
jgi:hypothetical protein